MQKARILVVDDDPDIHVLLASILTEGGCSIESAFDGNEALAKLDSGSYELVLTDVRMPGMDGLDLLAKIQERRPAMPVVVMTAQNTPENVIRAIRERAFAYFSKPFSASAVRDIVSNALESHVAQDDIEVLSARPNWVALRLRCKLRTAERLVQFIRELPVGLTVDQADDMAMGFRELLMNAIEHGGQSDPEKKVEVACVRASEAILYYIRDPGKGFSFDNLPHAAISDSPEDPFHHAEVRLEAGMRPGGLGIYMTQQIADELIYSEKGNEVLLIKYLRRDEKKDSSQ
jgi:CheY-like chemotaxis protein/anti-sigma regulatory factor (Ser/Thr protein kinase)